MSLRQTLKTPSTSPSYSQSWNVLPPPFPNNNSIDNLDSSSLDNTLDNSRRVLLNAIHRRSILLLDGACRGTLLPTLVPLFLISTTDTDLSPLTPIYSYISIDSMSLNGSQLGSQSSRLPADLSPYVWAGICVGCCAVWHTVGVGLGSSHLLGRLVVPGNPNRNQGRQVNENNRAARLDSNFRFSLLSSLPISLAFLLLTYTFPPKTTILLKSLQMFTSGLACRIASIRIKVVQTKSRRGRARTYSHVFGGGLNMGDDEGTISGTSSNTQAKYDDSGLSTRVSSGAVRVYLTGVGLMCFVSGFAFNVNHPMRDNEGQGSGQVDGDLEMGESGSGESEGFLGQRSRARTNTDEFFECLDDDEEDDDDSGGDGDEDGNSNAEEATTVYKNRRIINEATGEVSNVPPTLKVSQPPENFIKAAGSMHAAKKMWAAHLAWRKSSRIGSIHTRPHTHFDLVKVHYPHFIHGCSRDGYPVVYEQPGKMDLKGLFDKGLTIDDMIHHFIYHMEFLTQVTRQRIRRETKMPPPSEAISGLVVVMDVKGLSLSKLNGPVLKYLKAAGDMTNNHYPGSQHRVLIVNAPFWFSGAWGGIKNVLPRETAEAANVASTNFLSSLTAHIDPGQIPREYGGSSNHPATLHPYELELRNYVESYCEEDGLEEGNMGAEKGAEKGGILAQSADSKSQNSTQFDTPTNADAHHFAFDHVEKRWVPDDDNSDSEIGCPEQGKGGDELPDNNPRLRKDSSASVSMVQAGEWSTELSVVSRSGGGGAMRKTRGSVEYDEGIHVGLGVPKDAQHLPGEEQSPAMHQRVLGISTALVFLSCGLQVRSCEERSDELGM
ncbi:hypothetical protein TL16_g05007 [Triparma laevis f. inornata]|uniref:CRAL-TRIO domain-containing protein n=1 Tax=Triparma laevis f. inornata TaxID=1714386 RepID=A0A9W7E7G3_9STRA|nr:hypothetical protein TL16_g05007 [Triparma laevis f. inornata]